MPLGGPALDDACSSWFTPVHWRSPMPPDWVEKAQDPPRHAPPGGSGGGYRRGGGRTQLSPRAVTSPWDPRACRQGPGRSAPSPAYPRGRGSVLKVRRWSPEVLKAMVTTAASAETVAVVDGRRLKGLARGPIGLWTDRAPQPVRPVDAVLPEFGARRSMNAVSDQSCRQEVHDHVVDCRDALIVHRPPGPMSASLATFRPARTWPWRRQCWRSSNIEHTGCRSPIVFCSRMLCPGRPRHIAFAGQPVHIGPIEHALVCSAPAPC